MNPLPVVEAFGRHGADFVVVGSAARYLLGEDIDPADVDIVVSDAPANRIAVIDALIELDAHLIADERLQRLTTRTVLPWGWSWKTVTPYGLVDTIVRFIDGTGFAEHDAVGVSTVTDNGGRVRCRATRHEQ